MNSENIQEVDEGDLGPRYSLNIGTTQDGDIILSVHVDEIDYNILCEDNENARNTAYNWCIMMSNRFAEIASEVASGGEEAQEE